MANPETHPLPSRPAPDVPAKGLDAEHGIQLGLIEAAANALRRDAGDAIDWVDQLLAYTQAHFLSEQLLMRQHADPHYEAHVIEHERFLADLDTLRDHAAAGDRARAVAALEAHEENLLHHIRRWDRAI